MQRSKIAAIAAVCTIAVVQVASAADLPLKAPFNVYTPPLAFSWTGFYVGAALGAKWADTTWSTTSILVPGFFPVVDTSSPRDYDLSAFRVGGYLGYNWQIAPQWVLGVEGDWSWANKTATTAGVPGCSILCIAGAPGPGVDASSVKMGWDASLRTRLGYLVLPNLLAYGTGGVALQRFEMSATCQHSLPDPLCVVLPGNPSVTLTNKDTRWGWTIGAGLEANIYGNWLLRGEYRFSDFGTWDNAFNLSLPGGVSTIVNSQLKTTTQIATFGVAYKF
jgi:outer membrane immunogenic protein